MTTFVTVEEVPGRPGRYSAKAGAIHISSTRTPLLSMARRLREAGVSDDEELVLVRENSRVASMRARLGDAAKLTVAERDKGHAQFEKFAPLQNAAETFGVRSPAADRGSG
jgi:hypothetical protein